MADGAEAPQPEDAYELAEVHTAGGSMAARRPQHASVPRAALRRHSPKVGAQCGNSARWDLCGGPGVTSVPTATGSCGATREHRPDGAAPAADEQARLQ